MIEHVLRTSDALAPATTIVVVGHQANIVQQRLLEGRRDIHCVLQSPQLGTAHALQQAEGVLGGRKGTVVLLSGDVPLLTGATLRGLVETHLRRWGGGNRGHGQSSSGRTATAESSVREGE